MFHIFLIRYQLVLMQGFRNRGSTYQKGLNLGSSFKSFRKRRIYKSWIK